MCGINFVGGGGGGEWAETSSEATCEVIDASLVDPTDSGGLVDPTDSGDSS